MLATCRQLQLPAVLIRVLALVCGLLTLRVIMAALEHVVLKAAGSELPDPFVVPLLRLGAWAAAFDRHAGNPLISDDELGRCVERFARLDPPREPAGVPFGIARDALRRAPLG